MQETTVKLGDTTQVDERSFTQLLYDLPGRWVKDKLGNMPFCPREEGYYVPLLEANNVRSTISIASKDTAMRFETGRTEDGGILVWRLPDLEDGEALSYAGSIHKG